MRRQTLPPPVGSGHGSITFAISFGALLKLYRRAHSSEQLAYPNSSLGGQLEALVGPMQARGLVVARPGLPRHHSSAPGSS